MVAEGKEIYAELIKEIIPECFEEKEVNE